MYLGSYLVGAKTWRDNHGGDILCRRVRRYFYLNKYWFLCWSRCIYALGIIKVHVYTITHIEENIRNCPFNLNT